jgi:glycerol-3-phosphate acyltransferase PlsY
LDPSGRVIILIAVVVGHIYPITLGLHGGKGVATLIGGYLALDWSLALAALAVHVLLRRTTGFVSAASVALAWVFPLLQLVAKGAGIEGVNTDGTLGIAGLALLITWRHRSNFQRIRAGVEDRYDDRPAAEQSERSV